MPRKYSYKRAGMVTHRGEVVSLTTSLTLEQFEVFERLALAEKKTKSELLRELALSYLTSNKATKSTLPR